MASDAPLFSGVITGIIAGVMVSLLSGSELSISGPAAGLTLIVAMGIKKLGGFDAFLVAVVLSGVFQILLGWLKAGAIASLFPHSVIKGMLVAIGLTIILKQIPHALGGAGDFQNELDFIDWFGNESAVTHIILAVLSMKGSVLAITAISLLLLVLWETPRLKSHPVLSRIPGALVAVLFGAMVNQIFHAGFPDLALHAHDGHLVQLPLLTSSASLLQELNFPNFSAIYNRDVWLVALTIAAIGSIETLLCLESTDKIDPLHRISNPNRELVAQGIGNFLAGVLGGIPMTSVIVRSSANIYAGGRTRMAGFFHGLILLFSVLALPWLLNHIPLGSLAAVLLMVGYKLAHPSLIIKTYRAGNDQFVPFAATIVAILFTDLLRGVLIGVAFGLIYVVKASYYSAILVIREDKQVFFRFTKDVTFIHKARLRRELALIQPGSHVVFNGTKAAFIDADILQMLAEFQATAGRQNIIIEIENVLGRVA